MGGRSGGTSDTVDLPVVSASQRAVDALRAMRDHERSGVLVRSRGRWWLYEAAAVVVAVAEDPDVTIAELQPSVGLDGPDSAAKTVAVRLFLPPVGYVGPGPFGGGRRGSSREASMSLSKETLDRVSAGPRACYCRVDRKPVKNGTNGADCPDGHAKSVRCVNG